MRVLALPAVLLLAVACTDANRSGPTTPATRPSFVQNAVDTVGLPDLIVDSKATQQNWVNRTEDLPADFCSVIEGGVTPGTHDILRFTVTTPNIGNADVFVSVVGGVRVDEPGADLAVAMAIASAARGTPLGDGEGSSVLPVRRSRATSRSSSPPDAWNAGTETCRKSKM